MLSLHATRTSAATKPTSAAGETIRLYFGDLASPSFVLGMSSGARTFISGGDGDDYLYSKYSFVVGAWNVSGGAGNDTIGAFGSAGNATVTFAGDAGADQIVFDTNYLAAGLVLAGGFGNDRLLVLNSILPTADLHGGGDADELSALNLRSSRLSITGDQPSAAGGRDTANVRSCASGRFVRAPRRRRRFIDGVRKPGPRTNIARRRRGRGRQILESRQRLPHQFYDGRLGADLDASFPRQC